MVEVVDRPSDARHIVQLQQEADALNAEVAHLRGQRARDLDKLQEETQRHAVTKIMLAELVARLTDATTCPITQAPAVEPVVVEDGIVYDLPQLVRYVNKATADGAIPTSPLTREVIGKAPQHPSPALQKIVDAIAPHLPLDERKLWYFERGRRQFADGKFEDAMKSLQLPIREGLTDAVKIDDAAKASLIFINTMRKVGGAPDPRNSMVSYAQQYARVLSDDAGGASDNGGTDSSFLADLGPSDSEDSEDADSDGD